MCRVGALLLGDALLRLFFRCTALLGGALLRLRAGLALPLLGRFALLLQFRRALRGLQPGGRRSAW